MSSKRAASRWCVSVTKASLSDSLLLCLSSTESAWEPVGMSSFGMIVLVDDSDMAEWATWTDSFKATTRVLFLLLWFLKLLVHVGG